MKNYVDIHEYHDAIISEVMARADALHDLLNDMDGAYIRGLYKFYSQSFKAYHLQDFTLQAHNLFKSIAGTASLQLHEGFEQIIAEGTGSTFDMSHNADWLTHTRPIVEAFLHAKYMVEMMVRLNTAEPGSLRHVQAYQAVTVLFRRLSMARIDHARDGDWTE